MVKETNFVLADDDMEDDEQVLVVNNPKKKPVKKATRPAGRPKLGSSTAVVSARIPQDKLDAIEEAGLDVPTLFKHFLENEVLGNKQCPLCGQEVHKKGKKA